MSKETIPARWFSTVRMLEMRVDKMELRQDELCRQIEKLRSDLSDMESRVDGLAAERLQGR